ncbi:PDZ domain-containing protein, partial [Streptomyces sp. NPDC059835]|uniref:PDZ domain-containing protein n=1 Tax=Streptomyces sp. NPDC059835 TaxID=3346967 RepID=UPI00364D80FF
MLPQAVAVGVVATAAAVVTANAGIVSANATGRDRDDVPACVLQDDNKPPQSPPTPTAPTITTLQQAYQCIFDNSYAGPVLDSRTLLVAGFAEFTKELQRRGLERPGASLPALTGKRTSDWKAFAKRYQEVLATLPDDPELTQALFTATMRAMVASLHDDHAGLGTLFAPPGGSESSYGFGFRTLPTGGHNPKNTAGVVAPLYLETVAADTPAAKAGLRPGDVVVAVNDVPAFTNGVLNGGVFT